MTAAEFIARAHAVTDGATPGPWEFICGKGDGWAAGPVSGLGCDDYGYVSASLTRADAAFIAESRTLLPAATASIAAVLFQCSGDGDNVYRDDRYGTGSRVICVDVIEAAIAAALDPS